MKKLAILAVAAVVAFGVTSSTAAAEHWLSTALTVDSTNPQPWLATDDLHVGSNSTMNAVLTIENGGAVVNVKGTIARNVNYGGKVVVDGAGAGAKWTNNGQLIVADQGSGITAGSGNLSGILEIKNGGKVYATSSSTTYIARSHNSSWGPSNGLVTVDGSGSELFCGPESGSVSNGLVVGGSGNGTLTITNGGLVTAKITDVGWSTSTSIYGNSEGVINVDGAGSKLDVSMLEFGRSYSRGTLNITNGGLAETGYVRLGAATGLGGGETGQGFLNVTGSGSVLDVAFSGTHSMIIGGYTPTGGPLAPGTIMLADGGAIDAQKDVHVFGNSTLGFSLGNGSLLSSDTAVTILDGATIQVALDAGFNPLRGVPYDLVTAISSVTVDPGSLAFTDLSGLGAVLSANGTALQVTFTTPEPASVLLVSACSLLLLHKRRRS